MSASFAPRPVTPTSILTDRIDALLSVMQADPAADSRQVDELAEIGALARGLDPYLAAHTTPASSALTALAEATAAEDWEARNTAAATGVALEQEMLSGLVEGQFLKMLVAALRARSVLEIGLFTGYSALAMAEGLPEDGRLIACEVDDYAADFAAARLRESPHGHKIHIRRGPAAGTLDALAEAGQRFDFVFIDADKSGYLGYLTQLLSTSLLTDGALIGIDNTLMQGQPWTRGPRSANGEAIAAFNTAVIADPRIETVQLPLRDGLTLIRRRGDHG